MIRKLDIQNRVWWYFVVFTTIWGSRLPGISVPGFTLYPIRLIVVVWFMYKMINAISSALNKKVACKKNTLLLFVFILYGYVSLIWSCNVSSTVTTLIIYTTSILVYFLFSQKNLRSNKTQYMCEGFYVNMIIMFVIALREAFTGQYSNLSYDYYLSTYNMFGLYRPIAAFYNTNDLATFFSLSLPIAMFATENWRYKKIAKAFIIAISVVTILLTGSRAGIISLLLFAAFYMLYRVRVLNGSKKLLPLFMLLIAMSIFICFLPSLKDTIMIDNSFSSEDRIPIWSAAYENCKRYLFMGAGFGTSKYLPGSYGLTHNYFLELLCESGIVGFITFGAIVFMSIPSFKQIKRKKNRLIYLRIWGFVFLVSSICVSTMQGCYYLWAILGIGYALIHYENYNSIDVI